MKLREYICQQKTSSRNYKTTWSDATVRSTANVRIQFDELISQGDSTARFQCSISDSLGFITRYYGTADYEGGRLHLKTVSI